jgi:hypothetical protein
LTVDVDVPLFGQIVDVEQIRRRVSNLLDEMLARSQFFLDPLTHLHFFQSLIPHGAVSLDAVGEVGHVLNHQQGVKRLAV